MGYNVPEGQSARDFIKMKKAKEKLPSASDITVQLEEHIKKEQRKLERIREYPGEYDDGIREDITKRIDDLNDELKG